MHSSRFGPQLRGGLLVLPLALLVTMAVVISAAWQTRPGAATFGGNEWSMEIVGGTTKPPNPGQVTPPGGCDTGAPSGQNCSVPLAGTFTVRVNLDKVVLPDGDGDTAAGYIAWEARLNWSAGLTEKDRPGGTEVVSNLRRSNSVGGLHCEHSRHKATPARETDPWCGCHQAGSALPVAHGTDPNAVVDSSRMPRTCRRSSPAATPYWA